MAPFNRNWNGYIGHSSQPSEAPKQVLEINPRHPLISSLSKIGLENPLTAQVIEQIFANALILNGQQPDMAKMTRRIQNLMETAIKNSLKDQP